MLLIRSCCFGNSGIDSVEVLLLDVCGADSEIFQGNFDACLFPCFNSLCEKLEVCSVFAYSYGFKCLCNVSMCNLAEV